MRRALLLLAAVFALVLPSALTAKVPAPCKADLVRPDAGECQKPAGEDPSREALRRLWLKQRDAGAGQLD